MKFILIFGLSILNFIISENPYRVLGVAPYQKLSKIKKVFRNLFEKQNISDKEEYRRKTERLKKAYEDIKSSRKVEHEEIEDNILSGIMHLLEQCLISLFLAWLFINIIFKIISFAKGFIRNFYDILLIAIIFYNIYDIFFYYKLRYDSVYVTFFFSLFTLLLKLFKGNYKTLKKKT